MEVLAYTSVIGGCDLLRPAPDGLRCVCFTDDRALRAPGWEMRLLKPSTESPRMQSRRLRCRPDLLFPDADAFIWLDASCIFKDIGQLFHDAAIHEMAALAHPDRSSCRAESEVCVKAGYRTQAVHDKQMHEFAAAGYDFAKLTAGHLTWRRNTSTVAHFGEIWMAQIARYGVRDQCSLDFSAWAAGLDIRHLTGSYRSNPYFVYHMAEHHRRRKNGGA